MCDATEEVLFNLDDPTDVACIADAIEGGAYDSARRYFHARLEGHEQREQAAEALADYFHQARRAQQLRLQGHVNAALEVEREMQAIYATRIPRSLRW